MLLSPCACCACRLVGGYPEQACHISLKDAPGLAVADRHKLSKLLHGCAAEHAHSEEVCAFNLIEACQVHAPGVTGAGVTFMPIAWVLSKPSPGYWHAQYAAACVQEFLHARNKPCEEARAASLWHEMQRRRQPILLARFPK